jgi:myo-inositol-1-phosphate synthase
MSKINIAITGVGNVTKTLIKGLEFYKNSTEGLWHPKLAGFTVNDASIIGAYDIDSSKIGKKIKDVITDYKINSDLSVQAGIADDPIKTPNGQVKSVKYNEFVDSLKKLKPDFLVNLISSGMDRSSESYAKAALEVGCSFLNATSSKTITPQIKSSFESKGLMILGDDLMSQFGGTAFHRGMMEFMVNRGITIQKAYQLDVGGNADTQNTMAEQLREKKRKIKTESISVEVPYTFRSTAGTTEYAEQLGNSRVSYYWMEAKGFLGAPIEMDLSLRTNDSSNGCNVILDSVRAAKFAISKKDFAKADIISAYAFKNPIKKTKIRESIKAFEEAFAN